ncbi:MAG: DMT family transporter [Proteobacteria bacterium]|nr:DMT family transporter [Pseudomonadota bacterium]MDA0960955.1 DMT family transporter [Pseudomonadota bacterium]MDA1152290.1 DMT family transporter [Pseudomonadota bacterium]
MPQLAVVGCEQGLVHPMQDNPRLGIIMMIATTVVFSVQDGISRYLAEHYNVITVVTIRYMFFMAFVLAYSARQDGGIRKIASSPQLPVQIGRGLLLAGQICVAILSFSTVGLVNFHAVFASYPLMVMALSVPVLGEAVGWRRWLAVCIGFCGVLLILRPGTEMFGSASILPVLAAFMIAVYGILTRYAARRDAALTSFFWTAIAGGIAMLAIGPFFWVPPVGTDWYWMGLLCLTGTGGHYLLIKALDATKASTIQPFAYLQLVFASSIGILVFDDSLDPMLIVGSAIIVGSGLFALQRERQAAQS